MYLTCLDNNNKIKLYLDTVNSGTAAPFTGVYDTYGLMWNRKAFTNCMPLIIKCVSRGICTNNDREIRHLFTSCLFQSAVA